MAFTTYIANSFVYVYLSNPTTESILNAYRVFQDHFSVTTFRKSLNVHVNYKIIKCIETPDDLRNYLNEFNNYVNNVIVDLAVANNIQIKHFEVSNVVMTGLILVGSKSCREYDSLTHLNIVRNKVFDLEVLLERIKEKFGEHIFMVKIPEREGSSFPGIIIKFYNSLDDKEKFESGEISAKKISPASVKFFTRGTYTATNVKPTFIDTFVDILNYVASLSEEERLRKEVDISDIEIVL